MLNRRKTFESTLAAASKNKYKVLFDVAPVAIIEGQWEKNIKVINFNAAALELFKADAKTSFQEQFPKILNKLPKKTFLDMLSARVKGQVFEGDFFLPTFNKGERVYVLMRLVSIGHSLKSTPHVLMTFQDITKYKRNESDLKKLVQLDGLTKIFNQRTICQRLEQEFSRAKRYNLDLTCIIVDLDLFKKINDTFGHLVGNKCIKQVAQVLKQSIRKADIVGRYGGDEFLLILPETKPEQARVPVQRFLKAYEPFVKISYKGKTIDTSFSVGISGYPAKGITTAKGLIAAADQALYLSKEAGGNQVNIHSPKSS